jgi:hypothetical protein
MHPFNSLVRGKVSVVLNGKSTLLKQRNQVFCSIHVATKLTTNICSRSPGNIRMLSIGDGKEPDKRGEANMPDKGNDSTKPDKSAGDLSQSTKPPATPEFKIELPCDPVKLLKDNKPPQPLLPGGKPPIIPPTSHHVLPDITSSITSTLHFASQQYKEIERNIVESVRKANQRRLWGSIGLIVAALVVIFTLFGTEIRKYFTARTVDLAKETLENDELKVQTKELATAVVQTILDDKGIASQTAIFLQEATATPETQKALLKLTIYLLQHPDTLAELTKLSQKLIVNLANDKVCLLFDVGVVVVYFFWFIFLFVR